MSRRSYGPGVIRTLEAREVRKKSLFYNSTDIEEKLGVGKSYALEIIKELRNELINAGMSPKMIKQGYVPKEYFDRRYEIALERALEENSGKSLFGT